MHIAVLFSKNTVSNLEYKMLKIHYIKYICVKRIFCGFAYRKFKQKLFQYKPYLNYMFSSSSPEKVSANIRNICGYTVKNPIV